MAEKQPSAKGSETMTLADIEGSARFPTLIIRRPPLNPEGSDGSSIFHAVNTLAEALASTGRRLAENVGSIYRKDLSKKEEKASKKVTEENTKKVHAMLDQFRDDLTGVLETGIRQSLAEMPRMTVEQQRELIEFWKQIKTFVTEFLKWIDQVMDNMIKKLLDGYHLNSALVAEIFQKGVDELKGVMSGQNLPEEDRSQVYHK